MFGKLILYLSVLANMRKVLFLKQLYFTLVTLLIEPISNLK
jgi:hypothetical protein